jgi:hypothetical protein
LGHLEARSPPPTPRSSNVDELNFEVKVLKLQEKIAKLKKKLKSKKGSRSFILKWGRQWLLLVRWEHPSQRGQWKKEEWG